MTYSIKKMLEKDNFLLKEGEIFSGKNYLKKIIEKYYEDTSIGKKKFEELNPELKNEEGRYEEYLEKYIEANQFLKIFKDFQIPNLQRSQLDYLFVEKEKKHFLIVAPVNKKAIETFDKLSKSDIANLFYLIFETSFIKNKKGNNIKEQVAKFEKVLESFYGKDNIPEEYKNIKEKTKDKEKFKLYKDAFINIFEKYSNNEEIAKTTKEDNLVHLKLDMSVFFN